MEDSARSQHLVVFGVQDHLQNELEESEDFDQSFEEEEDDEEREQRKQKEAQDAKQKEMESYDFKEDDPEVQNAQLLLKYA
jgi:hypothetical protein